MSASITETAKHLRAQVIQAFKTPRKTRQAKHLLLVLLSVGQMFQYVVKKPIEARRVKHSRLAIVLLVALCSTIVIAGAMLWSHYYPPGTKGITNDKPPISNPGQRISSPVDERTLEQANKDQREEEAALSGTYEGKIAFAEAKIFGEATLTIKGDRFTLESKTEGKRLLGRMVAKRMDDHISMKLIFDDRLEKSEVSKSFSFAILTNMENGPTELPNLSLRATLTSDGWVIKSAPEEKHEVLFVQKNCPPYPYCRPVRRCRPCE